METAEVVALAIVIAPLVAPAGTTKLSFVLLLTVTAAVAELPIFALVAPVNPLPVTMMRVPTGPLAGLKLEITGAVGGGVVLGPTLNCVGENAARCGFRTATLAVVAWLETVKRISVSLTTVGTMVRSAPSQIVVAPMKPEPVIETTVPAGPDTGANALIVGWA